MAPALELEAASERARRISERHRILIVAAVTAVVGEHFRILEIKPLHNVSRNGGDRFRPFLEEVPRAGNRSPNRAPAQGADA